MSSLAADVRYALRSLRQSPGFFSLVIGILGLGMAASVAVFSIVDGVLLRALPYRDPSRLVRLDAVATRPPYDSNGSLSYADFEQFRAQSQSFEELAITYRNGWSVVTLTGGPEPQKLQGAFVSSNLLAIFGRSPIAGRVFTEDETRRGEKVLVVSESFSYRRFGSPTQALGQDLEIGGTKWRVIGVMPADVRVPFLDVQLWAPIFSHPGWLDRDEPNPQQRQRWDVFARLKPGTPLRAVQTEADAIMARLTAAVPEFHKNGVRVVPLLEYFTAGARKALWVFFSAVAFLLLITFANVGNLLLARAATRRRELAVRAALGANRLRLLRQIVVESLTFSFLAGLVGVSMSLPLLRLLKVFAPSSIPRMNDVQIDARTLLFALALVLATGILLGIVAAWRASRREPREFLSSSGRGSTENRDSRRIKSVLVASEFALAMVLLTGAVLLARSFAAVLNVDLGFRPEHVLTVRLALPGSLAVRQKTEFYSQVLRRVSEMPGVLAAGGAGNLFFLDESRMHALRQVEGRPPDPVAAWKPLVWTQVSGAYFQAMGLPLLRGRYFSQNDHADSPPVVIVNEALARRYWPGEDPVGKRLKGFDPRGKNDDWLTVVGLVKDTRNAGLDREPLAEIYELQAQRGEQIGALVIRTSGDPVQISAAARSVIHQTNASATVSSIVTLEQLLDQQMVQRRFQTWLIGVFSVMALTLAALGVFAVMHYTVAAKRHEIGIRMAVGARTADILRLILGDGAKLALAGILAGTIGAAWATEAIAGMLYSVRPGDPLSFAAAALVLAIAGLAACYLPARRAAQVDPVLALREE